MSRPADRTTYRGIARLYDRVFGVVNDRLAMAGLRASSPASGSRVLDVCCGTGAQLALYEHLGCRLSGLDASPAMLDVARQRLGHSAQLVLGDARRMPHAKGIFDLVTCKLALHEMAEADRSAVLSEAGRVVSAQGRILLIDFHGGPYQPIHGWMTRAAAVVVECLAGGEHFQNHGGFLAAGGLIGLAHQSGLRVEQARTLGGGTFAVLCLARP